MDVQEVVYACTPSREPSTSRLRLTRFVRTTLRARSPRRDRLRRCRATPPRDRGWSGPSDSPISRLAARAVRRAAGRCPPGAGRFGTAAHNERPRRTPAREGDVQAAWWGAGRAAGRRRAPRATDAPVEGGLRAPGRAAAAARVRRCVRIWPITVVCVMHATIRMVPWPSGTSAGRPRRSVAAPPPTGASPRWERAAAGSRSARAVEVRRFLVWVVAFGVVGHDALLEESERQARTPMASQRPSPPSHVTFDMSRCYGDSVIECRADATRAE